MIVIDEDALICDFAEVYHIYDFRAIPARYASTLAYGLRDNSRIKMALAGTNVPVDTLLLAMIADAEKIHIWQKTEDGVKGRNKPKSILSLITGEDEKQETCRGFSTPEEFMAWRESMLEK